jgi:D-tagatose-bisphosphate aldolase class II non-catalytic subunit
MTDPITDIVRRNRAGETAALPSICSAHPDVLRASLLLAQSLDQPALIEATSNQVNQFGGYTGMTPVDFVGNVRAIADDTGTDLARLIFGGDHLGPQAWNGEASDQAMAKAKTLVSDYVRAGFTKIHLDCSEPCAGDPATLDDGSVARRAADLAQACEAVRQPGAPLHYVVGTEVPPPGGVRAAELNAHMVQPTRPEAAKATLETHFNEFQARGLADAASRIVALVVQPGVEFGPTEIDHLPDDASGRALKAVLQPHSGLCFEAHSTDYQKHGAYPRLANMGFAFQKVGPALTFAYRQAIYGLDLLVDVLDGKARSVPVVRDVLEAEMLRDPRYWKGHYSGDFETLRQLRHFSYSDRIRYYWPSQAAQSAVSALRERLRHQTLPTPMLEQFFARQRLEYADRLASDYDLAYALVLGSIQQALRPYYFTAPAQGEHTV